MSYIIEYQLKTTETAYKKYVVGDQGSQYKHKTTRIAYKFQNVIVGQI